MLLKYLYILEPDMRFWYVFQRRATKAQASLRKLADSPEPSLLMYTKYERDQNLDL